MRWRTSHLSGVLVLLAAFVLQAGCTASRKADTQGSRSSPTTVSIPDTAELRVLASKLSSGTTDAVASAVLPSDPGRMILANALTTMRDVELDPTSFRLVDGSTDTASVSGTASTNDGRRVRIIVLLASAQGAWWTTGVLAGSQT